MLVSRRPAESVSEGYSRVGCGGGGGGQFHTLIREASGKHGVKVEENTDTSGVLISSLKEKQQCGRVESPSADSPRPHPPPPGR